MGLSSSTRITIIYSKVKEIILKTNKEYTQKKPNLYTTAVKANCTACSFYFEGQIFSESSKKLLFKR